MNTWEQDIDYYQQKLYAALGIPKEFLETPSVAQMFELQQTNSAAANKLLKIYALLSEAVDIYRRKRLLTKLPQEEFPELEGWR